MSTTRPDPARAGSTTATERLRDAESRLAAARRLRIDRTTTQALNALVGVCCRLLGTASGQVSILTDVQLVAAGAGAAAGAVGTTGPLDDSLCTLTAADNHPLALPDARLDARAAELAPVRSGLVRSYLGVPLVEESGDVVGSLCVFDEQPRDWSSDDVDTLQVMARAVTAELTRSTAELDLAEERLRWALSVDAGEVGSFDYDLISGQLVWDTRMQDLFGYADGQFPPTIEAITDRVHPGDLDRVGRAVEASARTGGDFEAEYRVVLPAGPTRWVQSRGKALFDDAGAVTRLVGATYDTTEVHHPRTGRLLEAMPSGFLSMDTQWRFTVLNAAAERMLGQERAELLGRTMWEAFPDTVGNAFETAYRTAVATQTPQTIEAFYPAPLNTWYEVLCWPTPEGLTLYFADINDRKRGATSASLASARLAVLAEVSSALLTPGEVLSTVRELPRLLVPLLADGCFVTLLEPDGRPTDVGSWHADPARREVLRQYTTHRREAMPAGTPVARALATGQSVRTLATDVVDLLPLGPARTLLGRLQAHSSLVLPVLGRGRLMGTLALFSGADRVITADDESTAQEIATRIGLALENARLAEAQSQLAEGLQRTLLTDPPEPDHAQIVVRYVPASESALVGGDWYDAFMQHTGATMLVIGDVVGHDVAAAAAMAQVRSLLRGIATYGGGGPAEVLRGLDTSMDLLANRTLATAAVARLSQTAREKEHGLTRLTWASAGHPPLLVLYPDGRQEFLTGARADLLLGVDARTHRAEHQLVLERGATVLLYTDGLVERRGSDLDAGQQRLQDAVAELADRSLDELCDGVIERLVQGRPDDDVALVAVRLHPQDAPRPPEAGPTRVPDPLA